MNQTLWQEIESLAASTVQAVVPALLTAYLNKAIGTPGAPAITIDNVGRIAGVVAATTVLQHLGAVQTPAPAAAAPAAPATPAA